MRHVAEFVSPAIPLAACARANRQCRFGPAEPLMDRSGQVPDVAVMRCRDCGVGVTVPPLADVSVLYADRGSQDFQPGTAGLARRIKHFAFRMQARGLLRWLPQDAGQIVDFGCGSGLLTRCIGDVADGSHVVGIDFHAEPPVELADRAYRGGADAETLVGTADAVFAMHVLEHGADADALVRRIASFAKPGGVVLIEVPDIDCVWASVFRRYWDAWYVPYHRVHFTRASLLGVVERAGLAVERIEGVSGPGLGRSLSNLLGQSNGLAFILATAILQPLQRLGERLSGRPSGLRLLARVPAGWHERMGSSREFR
jgi:SAM-dependent methyltransferase